LKSESAARIEFLLGEHTGRFVRDFLASAPVPERPTS